MGCGGGAKKKFSINAAKRHDLKPFFLQKLGDWTHRWWYRYFISVIDSLGSVSCQPLSVETGQTLVCFRNVCNNCTYYREHRLYRLTHAVNMWPHVTQLHNTFHGRSQRVYSITAIIAPTWPHAYMYLHNIIFIFNATSSSWVYSCKPNDFVLLLVISQTTASWFRRLVH